MENNNVLTISHLSKHLGSKLILNDISVEVNAGEIFGFLGPNGSGKTTTIKVMLGLLSLEAGDISICGYDIKSKFCEAMANIGGIIENPEMYKFLTGRENLMQYLRMYDGVPESRIAEVAEIVGLSDRINDKVGKYSLGMRQRLGLAQALLNKPKLLVLDEPTNGLDPAGIKELRDILKYLSHNEGTAVFVSSHQLAELDLMCDRVAIINRGTLIAVKSIEEIRMSNRDGMEHFDIETVEPAVTAACSVLDGLANSYTVEGGKLSVSADTKAGGHGITETIHGLVMAGVPIKSAVPVTHSLEEVFLEITKGSGVGAFAENAPVQSPVAQNPITPPTAGIPYTADFGAPPSVPEQSDNKEGGDKQ